VSTGSQVNGAPFGTAGNASSGDQRPPPGGLGRSEDPSPRPVSRRLVAATVSRATTTCVDLPQSRNVHLPRRLARLPAPLPAAQAALIVAERTYRSLSHAPVRGGAPGRDAVSTARARITALESVNYALERHDSTALAIATREAATISARLDVLGLRSHLRGCR
jgi:hypothetical protein